MSDASLHGKVAIVTGASREIGAALARRLARAGAAVLVAHYREPELAAAVVDQIVADGGQALPYDADCAQVAANEQMIARAVAQWGRLDIFAANAGLAIARSFLDTDEASWDTLIGLNLKGSFFGAQFAARQMIAQGDGGRIVFSSSVTGVVATPDLAAYGITKAALRHMATTLGAELGSYGITVNALGIGATLNERNLHDNPHYERDWNGVIPTGRVGLPDDAAAALVFLCSPAAAMVNGHTLMIDGGWSSLGCVP